MSRPSSPESLPPAVEIAGVSRLFGERAVLRRVSFTVDSGQTLAILGPNGAGKTTLLKVVAGLLGPSQGRATVLGAQLPKERAQLRGRVGFVGHEPLLYRDLTPRENLALQCRLHDLATRFADRPVKELSRGMVQRVAVGRAVVASPPLLLLDEPQANLDPRAREWLEPLVGKESGRTRLLTSHDPEGALREADLVLGLRSGSPVFLLQADAVGRRELEELYR
jgi:heme exporter protein A